jgi:hypothetical protein
LTPLAAIGERQLSGRLILKRLRSASAQSLQKKGAVAPCSWAPEESQIESCEHQDNANVRCQPFPESVSEEREIYTDYDGYHCHHVKRDSDLSTRFWLHGLYRNGRNEFPGNRLCSGEFCDQPMAQVDPEPPLPMSASGRTRALHACGTQACGTQGIRGTFWSRLLSPSVAKVV